MNIEKQVMKQITPIKFESGNEFVLPNFSGLRERIVTKKLIIDEASNTYFRYNSVTSELELYVNGVIMASW